MKNETITHLNATEIKSYFPSLLEIPENPKELSIIGDLKNLSSIKKFITIVGTRKPTPYGIKALERIIEGLAGYPIAIVSGLAYGIDSIAHKLALKHGIMTISVPGSGLDEGVLYPRAHVTLAREILERGGLLLSEFPDSQKSAIWTFPKRNRIMAGLSEIILCIEAEQKSGSLITTKFATDFNKTVAAVPGSIFSSLSNGPNFLIKLGAFPITCAADLLELLGFDEEKKETISQENFLEKLNHIPHAEKILALVSRGVSSPSQIEKELSLAPQILSVSLSLLELEGIISLQYNNISMK